jgi:glycosyltransferase involved in cell wall biosynthesis
VQVHTDFASNAFGFSSLHNHLRRHIAWFVLRRASHIRVVLQKTKDEIVARGIKVPVTVLPIYVDVGRFASISRTKHPRWKIAALCVGRLEKEKNFARAIDAVAAARKIGHDIGLTIIGSGSQLPRLRERAMRLGIVDRVEFAGWQNDLTKYYSQADIVLVPSRYEGYGLVIVEALAAGIPVLSTDVGVAREAGTILTTAKEFPHTLMNWIKDGPRQASLLNLPYRNFDEYVNRYCDDVAETVAN